jgi:hypothetical protein
MALLACVIGCAGLGVVSVARSPEAAAPIPPADGDSTLWHRADLAAGKVRDCVVQVPAQTEAALENASGSQIVQCLLPLVYVPAAVLAVIFGGGPTNWPDWARSSGLDSEVGR